MLKSILTISLCILCMQEAFAQTKSLTVSVKEISSDSLTRYRVVISNFSDSVAVIPHSIYFDISETDEYPIHLVSYAHEGGKSYYSLRYSPADTLSDPQIYPFTANFLLPHQQLDFIVGIHPMHETGIFSVRYFLVYDIDYRTFQASVSNNWLQAYKVRSVETSMSK